jgi:8-oxo-dGTP pyrophosphatase MutT (NUDIX family)
MKDDKPFTIRSYRATDRAAVRRLCCETGFLGEPIDPVYEDHELFADFLTSYYTDHEPESSFVLEVEGELRGYLLGSRKPLRNQLYAFEQNIWLFCRAAPHAAFPHQSAAGRAKGFDNARADERIPELSLPLWGEAGLRPDRHVRKPARREDVRALRV